MSQKDKATHNWSQMNRPDRAEGLCNRGTLCLNAIKICIGATARPVRSPKSRFQWCIQHFLFVPVYQTSYVSRCCMSAAARDVTSELLVSSCG